MVVLGNKIIFGKNDSVVVGLPYTWLGHSKAPYSETDGLRYVGTIGKIDIDSSPVSSKLLVPKPQKSEKVVKKEGGAISVSYTHLTLPTKRIV